MIGQTISHYKILEKLGEGGMGVVYKAEDTKLNRTIALKFLPDRVNKDEATKARFLQEAQAAAGLNHPNICTIYGIDEHEGQLFISMEYIDGGTLRQKLPCAKTDDALTIAMQIGEALQDAHSKGIVHRDIKADNVMLNSKGQVKVMDFGLAKLKGSLKLTRTSSTVGTLGYMAPEQIQGGEVDHRSDIFSFGVLLFEILTGKLPFRGDHEAAMVYSIVNEAPEGIQKYLPDASPELAHILDKILEKDPAERYQTAADLVVDLRRVKKQSTRVSRTIPLQQVASAAQQQTPVVGLSEPPPRTPSGNKLWIAMAVLVLAIGAGLYVYLTNGSQQSSSTPLLVTLNPQMTLRVLQIPLSQVSYSGISSDGNWLSFPGGDRNGKWDIYYMHTSSTKPKRITNDSMAFSQQVSDISPDGSQVAYTQSGGLSVASALGGVSRKIIETAGNVRWRPDAQRLGYVVFQRTPKFYYELWSVKPDGSDKRLDFADSAGTSGRYSFAWSLDGRSVAWIRSFENHYQEVITRELETGKERQLTFDKKNIDDVCWLQNGMILFSSNKSGNTNLWVVPATGGTAQQVTKGSGPDIGVTASADAKKVVYLQQQPVGYIWTANTRSPNAQQVTFEDRDMQSVCFSPDKKRIAFIMGDPDPLKQSVQLYVQDRDGNNRREITSDGAIKNGVVWSPDGKWIAYQNMSVAQPSESAKVCIVDAERLGSSKAIGYGFPIMWISDTSLVIARAGPRYFEKLSLKNGDLQKLYEDSTFAFPVASGKQLFYFDNRKESEGVWIIPAAYRQNPSHMKPTLVEKYDNILSNALNLEYFYYMNKQQAWWRYHFQSRKRERLNLSFPGLDRNSSVTLSGDGEEVVYVARKVSGKLVMIENLFK